MKISKIIFVFLSVVLMPALGAAPVVFGTFAAAVSMQSGAPTFGTPEPSLILYATAALARRLGVPFRSGGGLCASKVPDAQAAYEAANTLQTSALAGVNCRLHAAGWLEGGLVMSYEKFILDADQASIIGVMLKGVDLSENGQALDALRELLRVLRPGGVLRLGLPDLDRAIEAMASKSREYFWADEWEAVSGSFVTQVTDHG